MVGRSRVVRHDCALAQLTYENDCDRRFAYPICLSYAAGKGGLTMAIRRVNLHITHVDLGTIVWGSYH